MRLKNEETTIEIEYRDRFNVTEYYVLVNDIADGFFGEEGDFIPHIGDMVAMLIFYNECILNKEVFDTEEYIDDPFDADALFENEAFIECFNEAIAFDGEIKYDFANAFKNAMEIVNYRNSSMSYVMNEFMNGFSKMVQTVTETVTDENMEKLTEFAKAVSDKDFSAQAVGDAFAKTEAFKKILGTEKENDA